MYYTVHRKGTAATSNPLQGLRTHDKAQADQLKDNMENMTHLHYEVVSHDGDIPGPANPNPRPPVDGPQPLKRTEIKPGKVIVGHPLNDAVLKLVAQYNITDEPIKQALQAAYNEGTEHEARETKKRLDELAKDDEPGESPKKKAAKKIKKVAEEVRSKDKTKQAKKGKVHA